MIDDYFKEYYYLSDFDRGSGLKQNLNIATQVLGSLTRVMQIHNREIHHSITEEDNVYYRSNDTSDKASIILHLRINTFLDKVLCFTISLVI